jgi:hypothetical protein
MPVMTATRPPAQFAGGIGTSPMVSGTVNLYRQTKALPLRSIGPLLP